MKPAVLVTGGAGYIGSVACVASPKNMYAPSIINSPMAKLMIRVAL